MVQFRILVNSGLITTPRNYYTQTRTARAHTHTHTKHAHKAISRVHAAVSQRVIRRVADIV